MSNPGTTESLEGEAQSDLEVHSTDPVDAVPIVDPLSVKINRARNSLLQSLQNQLETCLAEQLKPEQAGVPFVRIEDDPAQIAAIKKVINALYHAEEAFKIWETTDNSSLRAKITGAKQHYQAITQVYKSLASLNDATPEIQAIIADNYSLIEPVITATYDAIKSSGWVSEFAEMEVTEQASYLINQGTELIGPVPTDTGTKPNPLLDAFSKLNRLMNVASDSKKSELSPELKQQRAQEFISLLNDLEGNLFIQKLSAKSLAESNAINGLLGWLKTVQENEFEFTRDSIQKYISWSNQYLGPFILAVDQFERQSYLKSGLLSSALCESADRLAKEINKQLSESTLDIDERIQTMDSLKPIREHSIQSSQIENLQAIATASNHIESIGRFFNLLEQYKGKSFADILEADRVELRQIYPDIQFALAHSNLDLENKLTNVLNMAGPTSSSSSWWSLAAGAVNYVSGFVKRGEIDSLFLQEVPMHQFYVEKIQAEHLKFTIAESARAKLDEQAGLTDQTTLDERVQNRSQALRQYVKQPAAKEQVHPGDLIPVKATSLNNLRGNITYLQELHLSEKVAEVRTNIRTLLSRHLPDGNNTYFTGQPPYRIDNNEPEVVVHIKKLENELLNLQNSLLNFESANSNFGVISQAKLFIAIAKSSYQLKYTLTALSPAARSTLAPVISEITAFSTVLSGLNYRSSDMSDAGRLQQLELSTNPSAEESAANTTAQEETTVEEITEELATVEAAPVDVSTVEVTPPGFVDYAKQIAEARSQFLAHLQSSLTAPLARFLVPQSDGVPFVNFDQEPPQIVAIKRVINSMYYAESAMQVVNKMNTGSVSTIDKMVLAHQGMVAVSHIYKSVELLRNATPEVSRLLKNNYDFIEPMIKGAENLVKNTGWINQFTLQGTAKSVGSYIGRGLNLFQSDGVHVSDSSSLVNLFSEVPLMLNSLSRALDPNIIRDESKVKITQYQIDSITLIAEKLFEKKGTFFNYVRGTHALISFIELFKKINNEGNKLQKKTLEAYQQWMEREYPQLISLIDELEVRNYLNSGLLSSAIVTEINAINRKLNEQIVSMDDPNLNMIPLSSDLSSKRDANLQKIKEQIWMDQFHNEEQKLSARTFFDILQQYKEGLLSDLKTEDLAQLRLAFAPVQEAMSHINTELSNALVNGLNQLESPQAEGAEKIQLTVSQLLNQEPLVHQYLEEQSKLHELNIQVIDEARIQLRPDALPEELLQSDTELRFKTQERFILEQSSRRLLGPGELISTQSSSTNSARGMFSSVQELKLSSYARLIKEQFHQITKNQMSPHVLNYLVKPDEQPLHDIGENDPAMVRQIKMIDNGLYHLEQALNRFEQLSYTDSLVSQLKKIMEIQNEINQLKSVLSDVSPEIKAHYGKLITQIVGFSSVVQNIEYDQEDTAELRDVLKRAKVEILRPADLNDPPIPVEPNEQEHPTEEVAEGSSTAVRGIKLGLKYLHSASPKLENARVYLLNRYPYFFNAQQETLRGFSREQLADPEFMQNEVTRLNQLLNNNSLISRKNYSVFKELSKQLFRVGAQSGEIAGMMNALVTLEYRTIKEVAYKEYIQKLSQTEDLLGLKPGALMNQGIAVVDEFFLSSALELDMIFEDKLALVDEAYFLNVLLEQTQQELDDLEMKLKLMPSHPDFEMLIAIKKDKIAFLNEQIKSFEAKDLKDVVELLVDDQFEVELRKILASSFLDKPIIQQYEQAIRAFYNTNKESIMAASDIGTELAQSLHEFNENSVKPYRIVYQGHFRLSKFADRLPAENQNVKDYINGITRVLENGESPIEERADLVKSLPSNSTFVDTIGSAVEGENFLLKFKRFVQRVVSSVSESLVTGANIISTYREIKLEQQMRHIEKSLSFKAGLVDMKNGAVEPASELTSEHEENVEANDEPQNNSNYSTR
ncbi:SdhB [Legionella sp. km535]|uniref:SdhB n=1 Tax=Legionella sp. km535 TaxID=2498107 RepID=UPI000F8F45CA|nr:SdhB [Legionella sp. km535]RUR17739.1 SdhB [Legionella sp. km535]